MFVSKRVLKDGSHYYSFSYDDPTGKRIRLIKSEHPHFTEEKEAREWADSQDGQRKARLDLIARKNDYKTKYYDFAELVNKYASHLKDKQPNSHANFLHYFETYALSFFITIKKADNPNNWHMFFSDFRDWLSRDATIIAGTKLKVGSANNIILSVNNFLGFLSEKNLIDSDSAIKKCRLFDKSLIGHKTFENVASEAEFAQIHLRLKEVNASSAEFFWLLYHTGMRLTEALSLPMNCLYKGEIETGTLHEELTEKKIKYVGYIILESQCTKKSRVRDKTGHIKRKALKGRKTISAKNSRIIPVFNIATWNILAKRFKKCKIDFDAQLHGADKRDYLLFEEVAYASINKHIKQAYKPTAYKSKTPHDMRHSFCTIFTGKYRSLLLSKVILGHKSDSFDRYLHIYEEMVTKAKQQTQEIDLIEEIDEAS